MEADAKSELDRLMSVLFGAFTNVGGIRPNLTAVRDVSSHKG